MQDGSQGSVLSDVKAVSLPGGAASVWKHNTPVECGIELQ